MKTLCVEKNAIGGIVRTQAHKYRIILDIVIARSSSAMNNDNLFNLSHTALPAGTQF